MPLWGNPNPERICTSHVEPQNLSIRTAMRRATSYERLSKRTQLFSRPRNGRTNAWRNYGSVLGVSRLDIIPMCANHFRAAVVDEVNEVIRRQRVMRPLKFV